MAKPSDDLLVKSGFDVSGQFCMASIYSDYDGVRIEAEFPAIRKTLKSRAQVKITPYDGPERIYERCCAVMKKMQMSRVEN
jgi:hypothetical protein